jgi:hypothetical protein
MGFMPSMLGCGLMGMRRLVGRDIDFVLYRRVSVSVMLDCGGLSTVVNALHMRKSREIQTICDLTIVKSCDDALEIA